MFEIGQRVKIKEDALDGYVSDFRRFVAGKIGEVQKPPYERRGCSLVQFDPKIRGRGRSRREWIADRDLECADEGTARG